jgi:hypothetical protein
MRTAIMILALGPPIPLYPILEITIQIRPVTMPGDTHIRTPLQQKR